MAVHKAQLDDWVKELHDGIEITFPQGVKPEIIERQVEQCKKGTCKCCTPSFHKDVTSIEIIRETHTKVHIKGNITRSQVVENLLGCAPVLLDNGREIDGK